MLGVKMKILAIGLCAGNWVGVVDAVVPLGKCSLLRDGIGAARDNYK